MATVAVTLRDAARRLAMAGLADARLEARVLLEVALPATRVWIYQHPDARLDEPQSQRLSRLVEARLAGEPLAYLVGEREFFGRPFMVDRRVLIPRPETEILLEAVLDFAHRVLKESPGKPLRVADVGTGSGILAVSLSIELPRATIVAIDRSGEALEVARSNAERHGAAARVRFVQADLLEGLVGPFDLIVANLPYVPTGEIDHAPPELRREPRLALDGGPEGLDIYRRFFQQAPSRLAPRGGLFLEIGADQGPPVAALAQTDFPNRPVRLIPDLEGRDRVVAVGGEESGVYPCGGRNGGKGHNRE